MEKFSVDSLKADISFTDDLLLDSTFIILPKSVNVSQNLIQALKEWGIPNVLCNGTLSLQETEDEKSTNETENSKAKQNDQENVAKEKIGQNVKKILEDTKNIKSDNTDSARINMVSQVYNEYLNYIEQVFTHYTTHKEIDKEEISETVQELCIFIKEHRRYVLRINQTFNAPEKNFLIVHSLRTTVLSIAMAQQLHVPLSKMIELGVACILHEIGMLRLPPQLYMSKKKLSSSEKFQITKHTILGYTIANDLNFALPIQLGILEHHEKSNGTGYPRHLSGNAISSIARIISVACTYEAISSPRSYKDDRTSFDALLELIQNKDNQYDGNVLKALLFTVSLYPIGTFVYLSNRKIAEVIDSNPTNPKCPVVQLITEREENGSLKVVQTATDGIFVLRILTKQEEQDIMKLLEDKKRLVEEAQKEVSIQNQTKQEKNTETQQSAQKNQTSQVQSVSSNDNSDTPSPDNTIYDLKPVAASQEKKHVSSSSDDEMEEIDINFFN